MSYTKMYLVSEEEYEKLNRLKTSKLQSLMKSKQQIIAKAPKDQKILIASIKRKKKIYKHPPIGKFIRYK